MLGLCIGLPFIFRDLWSTFAAKREFETVTGRVSCAYLDSVMRRHKFGGIQDYFLVFCLDGITDRFKVKESEAGFDPLQDKLSVNDTLEISLNKRERETDGYRHAWSLKRNGMVVFGVEDKAREKRGELLGFLRLLALIALMAFSFMWVGRIRQKRRAGP